MSGDVNIDLGSALEYAEIRLRKLFGKDAGTQEFNARIERITRTGLRHAAWVQCIGMPKPIPIGEIYQHTKLIPGYTGSDRRSDDIDAFDILKRGNSIIRGGPGDGKTTLLHWILISSIRDPEY